MYKVKKHSTTSTALEYRDTRQQKLITHANVNAKIGKARLLNNLLDKARKEIMLLHNKTEKLLFTFHKNKGRIIADKMSLYSYPENSKEQRWMKKHVTNKVEQYQQYIENATDYLARLSKVLNQVTVASKSLIIVPTSTGMRNFLDSKLGRFLRHREEYDPTLLEAYQDAVLRSEQRQKVDKKKEKQPRISLEQEFRGSRKEKLPKDISAAVRVIMEEFNVSTRDTNLIVKAVKDSVQSRDLYDVYQAIAEITGLQERQIIETVQKLIKSKLKSFDPTEELAAELLQALAFTKTGLFIVGQDFEIQQIHEGLMEIYEELRAIQTKYFSIDKKDKNSVKAAADLLMEDYFSENLEEDQRWRLHFNLARQLFGYPGQQSDALRGITEGFIPGYRLNLQQAQETLDTIARPESVKTTETLEEKTELQLEQTREQEEVHYEELEWLKKQLKQEKSKVKTSLEKFLEVAPEDLHEGITKISREWPQFEIISSRILEKLTPVANRLKKKLQEITVDHEAGKLRGEQLQKEVKFAYHVFYLKLQEMVKNNIDKLIRKAKIVKEKDQWPQDLKQIVEYYLKHKKLAIDTPELQQRAKIVQDLRDYRLDIGQFLDELEEDLGYTLDRELSEIEQRVQEILDEAREADPDFDPTTEL